MELGKDVYSLRADGFWVDVGRFENFMKANKWILSRAELKEPVKIEALAEIRGPVHVGEDVSIEAEAVVVGPAIIGDGCRIRRGSQVKMDSVIGPNVEVGKECQIIGSIVYENTLIEPKSRLDDCIIGENCHIGSESIISEDVVVGPNCIIGSLVSIRPRSRIWPNIKIKSSAVISGIIRSHQD